MKNLSEESVRELRIAVIQSFAKRFAHGATVAYSTEALEDNIATARRILAALGIAIDEQRRLPDVVLYDAAKRWLYLIEVAGIMTRERAAELRELLAGCPAGLSLVTAFPDRTCWGAVADQIAWETAVWIAEEPQHVAFYNGGDPLVHHGSKCQKPS